MKKLLLIQIFIAAFGARLCIAQAEMPQDNPEPPAATEQAPQEQAPAAAPAPQPEAPAPEPATAPAPATVPAPAPQPENTVKAIPPATAVPPAPSKDGIILNFADAPLKTVLEYLSETAGFMVVEDTPVQGRVTLISKQPVSATEAVNLLNTVLTQQGFAAIRNGRILKIVALGDAKKMSVPVRVGADPEMISPTDEVVTQVIPLKYADAKQVHDDLVSLISSTADFSANQSSNALILTDTCSNIRRIVEIVKALDAHMATAAEVRVFQLKYANASAAAKLINDIFKEDQTAQSRTNQGAANRFAQFMRGRGPQPGGGGQQNQQNPDTASRAPKILASSDDRTNSLVVSGPSESLDVVAEVIKELDSNTAEDQSLFVYALKNAKADNVANVINSLINQSPTSAASTARRTTTTTGTSYQSTANRQSQQNTQLQQMMSQLRNRNTQGQTGQTTTTGGLSNAFCVADLDTNSLLMITSPGNYDKLKPIIESMDRPIPQVLIKVLIAELTWTDNLDYGAEYSLTHIAANGETSALTGDFGLLDLAGKPAGIMYKTINGDLTATIRAMKESGKLDILSRPHILTSDNQTASITVGSSYPFITNSRTTDTGQTINTIEYKDIGIILSVTPHINPDGLVIMDVAPQISSRTSETVPITDTVSAEVLANRSASTRIAIKDMQTIVIGGLMQNTKSDSRKGVPILSNIPLIGGLFGRTQNSKEKTELLIFLTPYVARDENELSKVSQAEAAEVPELQNNTKKPK